MRRLIKLTVLVLTVLGSTDGAMYPNQGPPVDDGYGVSQGPQRFSPDGYGVPTGPQRFSQNGYAVAPGSQYISEDGYEVQPRPQYPADVGYNVPPQPQYPVDNGYAVPIEENDYDVPPGPQRFTPNGYGAPPGPQRFSDVDYDVPPGSQQFSENGYNGASVQQQSVRQSLQIYEQRWPELYQVPLFRDICALGSGVKSDRITPTLIGQTSDYDYFNLFRELYLRNSLMKSYIYQTTGILVNTESDLKNFVSVVRQNPAGIFRSISLLARHPNIFQSELGLFALQQRSQEILRIASSRPLEFSTYQNNFVEIVRSRYYRKRFAFALRCPEHHVLGALQQAFRANTAGTLLLLKHVLTRRQLTHQVNDYLSVDYDRYVSSDSVFTRKAWKTPYYNNYQRFLASQSTSSAYGAPDYGVANGYGVGQSVIPYHQHWPDLIQVPLFRQICDLGSGVKSDRITQRLIQSSDYDYYNVFSQMYQRNAFIRNYIYATTGILVKSETDMRNFVSVIKKNPSGILRSISLLARHPTIFKSELVNFAIQRKSREIIEYISKQPIAFNAYQNTFMDIIRSRHYRHRFARIFGCKEHEVLMKIQNAFQRNTAGTLLLVKHILTRRSVRRVDDYLALNYNGYLAENSVFRQKNWKSQYYSNYQKRVSFASTKYESAGRGTRRATVQQTTVEEETVHQKEASGVNVPIAGGGATTGTAGSEKSVTRTVKKTTTTTINYQEQWPTLYQEPLFKEICHLDSNFRSEQITQRFLPKQEYNYENIFSALYNRNALFRNYMRAATGLQGEQYDRQRYYSLVREHPGSFLRMVSLFAKHPAVFKSNVAELIFSKRSAEMLRYTNVPATYLSDNYLVALTTSQTYRKMLVRALNCKDEPSDIRLRLKQAFRRNKHGTLLLIKHVLTRRHLFPYEDYMSVDYTVYTISKKTYWSRKKYRHNGIYRRFFHRSGRRRAKSPPEKKSRWQRFKDKFSWRKKVDVSDSSSI